jgi:hypothetical protein
LTFYKVRILKECVTEDPEEAEEGVRGRREG